MLHYLAEDEGPLLFILETLFMFDPTHPSSLLSLFSSNLI